jgi:hypothetical protein
MYLRWPERWGGGRTPYLMRSSTATTSRWATCWKASTWPIERKSVMVCDEVWEDAGRCPSRAELPGDAPGTIGAGGPHAQWRLCAHCSLPCISSHTCNTERCRSQGHGEWRVRDPRCISCTPDHTVHPTAMGASVGGDSSGAPGSFHLVSCSFLSCVTLVGPSASPRSLGQEPTLRLPFSCFFWVLGVGWLQGYAE